MNLMKSSPSEKTFHFGAAEVFIVKELNIMNDFNPLVSIIIPVYNGSNYMKEAIDSALAQTYKNIEIIVVNDGSTDNTDEIARFYGDNIAYFKKENGGVATALNLAIQNANGEYISWLSHDDVYLENKIERQIDELKNIVNKNSIIFSNFSHLIQKKNEIVQVPPLEENFSQDEPFYGYNMLNCFFSSKIHGCSLLIPKSLFEKIGFFDTEQKTTQDYALWMQFHKNGIRYHYINEALVVARTHSEQGTNALLPLHFQELNSLYRFAFDLFKKEFQKMELWQFEHFLNIIKMRGLDDTYAYMLSEWANGEKNKNKQVIWMYWENKQGEKTPDLIRLCWKTIIKNNKNDFQIKILTPSDVEKYLPDLDGCYQNCKEVAHKSHYIRFSLLHKYGGIWLDSDTVVFRSFTEITEKIKQFGFVCNGYERKNHGFFPHIGFLAAEGGNEICALMKGKIERNFDNTNQDWEFVGIELATLLKEVKKYFAYSMEYFCPYKISQTSENSKFESDSIGTKELIKNPYILTQSLAFSQRSNYIKSLNEAQLLYDPCIIGSLFRLGYGVNEPIKTTTLEKLTNFCYFLISWFTNYLGRKWRS